MTIAEDDFHAFWPVYVGRMGAWQHGKMPFDRLWISLVTMASIEADLIAEGSGLASRPLPRGYNKPKPVAFEVRLHDWRRDKDRAGHLCGVFPSIGTALRAQQVAEYHLGAGSYMRLRK